MEKIIDVGFIFIKWGFLFIVIFIIMENLIKEELNKMKYLFRYQRGVVISEQDDDDPFAANELARFDWRGKKKGLANLLNPQGMYAFNVGYEGGKYTLTSASAAIRMTKSGEETLTQTPPTKKKEPTLSNLNLQGSAFPYPDNMVQPKFESFPEAKKVYDSFIQSIVDFLKVSDTSKIGTFTIRGTADSARPTMDIPKGYAKLDHPGTLYDGKKDPNEMNQYLADTRGRELGRIIVKDVLDRTGVDISKNITYEKGINYYGQQGKRGFEFKNVTVTPSQTSVTIDGPDKVIPGKEATQTSTSSVQEPKSVETFFDLSPWGGGKQIPMTRLKNGDYAISSKYILDNKLFVMGGGGILNLWNVDGLNEEGEIKAEIKGNVFFANGISFGNIMSTDTQEAEYQYQAESTAKFVTKGRPMITRVKDGYAIISMIRFAFTTTKR